MAISGRFAFEEQRRRKREASGLLTVLHGVRKEDPFSGTGLNFRLFFLPGGDGVLVKNGKLRCGKRKRTLVTLAGSNRAEDATFPKSKAFSAKT